MSKPNAILSAPLTLGEEQIHRGSLYTGKALLCFPLLIGFALGVFFSPALFTRSEVETPAIDMRGASPMSMSCPRLAPVSVNAMQQSLRKLGVPPSPMEKFALTSYAATRDVSMAAQAKEEFAKLDQETKSKLKKMRKELVTRASAINPEDLAGVTEPLGFWDPAGFSKEGDIAAYRRAELKHGRVCMQAFLGIVVAENFHPVFDAWGDGPFVSAVASHFTPTATQNFWPALWVMTAAHELSTTFADYDDKDDQFGIGPFWDPLGLKPEDPEELLAMENKELNNARLAMHAVAGMMVQELLTGKPIFPLGAPGSF